MLKILEIVNLGDNRVAFRIQPVRPDNSMFRESVGPRQRPHERDSLGAKAVGAEAGLVAGGWPDGKLLPLGGIAALPEQRRCGTQQYCQSCHYGSAVCVQTVFAPKVSRCLNAPRRAGPPSTDQSRHSLGSPVEPGPRSAEHT